MSDHDPGLDLAALRARRGVRADLAAISDRIGEHIDRGGFVSFSGGKDSTVVVDLARRVDPDVPVVWFDSGMEFPETRDYVETLARRWDLNLFRLSTAPSGLEVLVQSGAWDHRAEDVPVPDLHEILIAAPSRRAHADHGPANLWGVRAAESKGRAQLYRTHLARQVAEHCDGCCTPRDAATSRPSLEQRARHGGLVGRVDGTRSYGPIWDWSDEQVWTYLAQHSIEPNPVYAKLAALGAGEHALRVGHLIDANQIQAGRVTWLRRGWPELYAELEALLPRLAEMV